MRWYDDAQNCAGSNAEWDLVVKKAKVDGLGSVSNGITREC
jgi:hypothetical protein